jgi:ribose transport system permease protein
MITSESPSQKSGSRFIELFSKYGIFLILIILVLALSIITPIVRGEQFFLSSRNLIQVMLQASINLIIAVAMTFIITSGGIDLSVGSILAISGIAAALAMKAGANPWLGFLVAMLAGTLCGLINGFLINIVGLVPFIATLGTMSMFRGLAQIFSDGLPIYGFSRDFLAIFAGRIGPVPVQVVVAICIAILGWFVLTQTRFGKYTTAIGGNEETAKLAGISVKAYKFGIYALGGLLTGVAAALLTARLSSADPIAGTTYELNAIAATVIGGTSLLGGSGSILGTVVGALVISLVLNGLNLLEVKNFWQPFVVGAVILFAAAIDVWRKRQLAKA